MSSRDDGGGTHGESIQPRAVTATLRNGSKPMALIGLPNVPSVFLVYGPSIQSCFIHLAHVVRQCMRAVLVRAIYVVDPIVYTIPR